MGKEMFDQTSVLSLSTPKVQAEGQNIISVEIPLYTPMDDTCSEQTLKKMELIFHYLHSRLLHQSDEENHERGRRNERDFGLCGPVADRSIKDIVYDDTSILHRCIHMLATGEFLDSPYEGALWDNQRSLTFAASDIIRNASTKSSRGTLKTIVGRQLVAMRAAQSLFKILNKFGVAPSHQHHRLKSIKQGEELMRFGVRDTDPHDLHLLLYDNIGFRRGGRNVGWEQFTAMQVVRIPKKRLQEWGIYPCTIGAGNEDGGGDGTPVASKERKDWMEERENVSFEEVMAPTNDDVECLAKNILKCVDLLLSLEHEEKLPSFDDARRLVENSRSVNWPDKIVFQDALGGRDGALGTVTSIHEIP